jgi:hypothetical protein
MLLGDLLLGGLHNKQRVWWGEFEHHEVRRGLGVKNLYFESSRENTKCL